MCIRDSPTIIKRIAVAPATLPESPAGPADFKLSLIHISEPTRLGMISYAVFCLKKKELHQKSTPLYSSAASDVYKRQPHHHQKDRRRTGHVAREPGRPRRFQ